MYIEKKMTMDQNKMNDLSSMGGMFNVNDMGDTDMDKNPNMFGGGMHMYTPEMFCKIQECAKMLEKYVDRFADAGVCLKFSAEDMMLWINDYYRTLVHGGPQLLDEKYYTGNDRESNLGIGKDGEFYGEELFQFLYRLYQAIVLYKMRSLDMMKFMRCERLMSCAETLEKYVSEYQKERKRMRFNPEDMHLWKQVYYPGLVQGGSHLLDDKQGIGADGEFGGYELFRFLYRLYKEIANQL